MLGIGAFGHDAAAALVDGETGKVRYAVAEERLSNHKHDWHFPVGAVHACCHETERRGESLRGVAVNFRAEEFITGTLFDEIDRAGGAAAGVSELKRCLLELLPKADYFSPASPNATTEQTGRWLAACDITAAAREAIARRMTWYFNWAVKYRRIAETIVAQCGDVPVTFLNHHLAHAASAFYNSGFPAATVLVIDGSGESDTVTVFRGDATGLSLVRRTGWPHSLGIFYLTATEHLGFSLGDEYKVMGMSAYGRPRFLPQLAGMLAVTEDAQLRLCETPLQTLGRIDGTGHMVFRFTEALRAILPPRQRSEPFRQEHFDFAASIQKLTEDAGVELARRAIEQTGLPDVALAGGVGLNGLMNEAIRQRSGCREMFIFPAAADDGCAVGAAQWLAAQHQQLPARRLRACYFGHEVAPAEMLEALTERDIRFTQPASIHDQIAAALAAGKIVARCHGRAEFGPRALGHRSILAHPGLATMKETLNARVKHREEFRPFAPACLREKAPQYFQLDLDAPFMLLITTARPGTAQLVPAVVHEDGTARVQTVSPDEHIDFYQIITAFERKTGLPIVLNTSFNVNGETIVDTAQDALESFGFMDIDYLALGPYWISKTENAARFPNLSHDAYLALRRARYARRPLGPLTELDVAQFDPAFFGVDASLPGFLQGLSRRKSAA